MSHNLNTEMGNNSHVYLKLENFQPSGSFKSRGIGNILSSKLAQLRCSGTAQKIHFYSSSGGNAGLACVHAAVALGCEATVVVPMTTAEHMIAKMREAGATNVIQKGASWVEADGYLTSTVMAEANARGENVVYVPPFDAPEIWDGNAAIVREIAKQISPASHHYPGSTFGRYDRPAVNLVDAIVCSVGGGGLFAGIMQGLDELEMHQTHVITAETLGADSLFQAVNKGELITLPAITSIATSFGARTVCKKALEYGLRENVSAALLSDVEAVQACLRFADEERLVVEPACGVCPALCYNGKLSELVPGLNKDSVVVLIVCGGSNTSYDILHNYLHSLSAE